MNETIEKISEGLKSNLTLYGVFSDAFGTKDDVELLKRRANMVRTLEGILAQTDHDEEVAEVVEDLCKILSEKNLAVQASKSGVRWSKAHLATLKMLLRAFRGSEGVKITLEIDSIIDDIKAMDSDEKQKEMLEEVFDAIGAFHDQYAVLGQKAFHELHLRLLGIFALYHDVFKAAPKPMQERLNLIYQTVIKAKEFSEATTSIGNHLTPLLSLIG